MYSVEVPDSEEPVAADDAQVADWYDIQDIFTENGLEMAFDHKEIITEFLLKKYPKYLPNRQWAINYLKPF